MKVPDFIVDPAKDLYKILGVKKNASYARIKRAHKKLSLKYHPDRPQGDEAKFKEIQTAYDVLGNKDNREYYNRIRREYAAGEFVSDFMSGKKKKKKKRKKSADFFDNIRNKMLKDFVIDSINLFSDQLFMEIPESLLDNFHDAVDFVYQTWDEVKERQVAWDREIDIKFGVFEIGREDIGKTDVLLD